MSNNPICIIQYKVLVCSHLKGKNDRHTMSGDYTYCVRNKQPQLAKLYDQSTGVTKRTQDSDKEAGVRRHHREKASV